MRAKPPKAPADSQEIPEDDARETPANDQGEPMADESPAFDLADLPDDAKTEIRRLNPRTANYALVGTLTGPSGWEQVAARWGGGQYQYTVKRFGKYVRRGQFEIDASVFPPRGAAAIATDTFPGETLTPPPDRDSLTGRVLDALGDIREALRRRQPESHGIGIRDMIEALTLLRKSESSASAGSILETLKMGIELGQSSTGEGKGLADVVAEVGPKIVDLFAQRNRMLESLKAPRQAPRTQTASPSPHAAPDPTASARGAATAEGRNYIVTQIRRIIEGAEAGESPDNAANLCLELLPAAVLDSLVVMSPEQATERIAEILPGKRDWLATPAARAWFEGFLKRLNADDEQPEESPGDGDEGAPEGDSGTQE